MAAKERHLSYFLVSHACTHTYLYPSTHTWKDKPRWLVHGTLNMPLTYLSHYQDPSAMNNLEDNNCPEWELHPDEASARAYKRE